MTQRAQVVVNKVISAMPPEDVPGKAYKVHKFICDGTVDGRPLQFTVKTLKVAFARMVAPGFCCNAEVDNFHGNVYYTIPRDFAPTGNPMPPPQPADAQGQPAPAGNGGGSVYATVNRKAAYSLDDLGNLAEWCFSRAKEFIESDDAAVRAMSTLFIASVDRGLRVAGPADAAPAPHPTPPPVKTPALISSLRKGLAEAGMGEALDLAGMSDDRLFEAWIQSNQMKDAFIAAINKMVFEKTPASEEQLPF